MPETEGSQQNIGAIRTRLDNLESMMRLSIASNPDSRLHIERVLRARKGASRAYLALESGPKSPDELRSLLAKSQATVSKVMAYLFEAGLVERHADPGKPGSIRWAWHQLERTIGISKVARMIDRDAKA